MSLRERLGKEWLFCDGGTGSILQKLGLKGGELPELWNLNRPEDIKNLNKSYFEAGSNIVNTNTFGANILKFSQDELDEIIRCAIPILYAGICSCAVGYTFQVLGQKEATPTIAALILCLESVFGVLAGAVLLHETMTMREILGCIIMFAAVVISNLPEKSSKEPVAVE